jgi:outer membrane cobalamin receptor
MRQILTTVLFFLLSAFISVHAQTGSIQGVVKDVKNGEELIGAIVKVQGTGLGAPSDAFGNFRIDNVKEGTYTLEINSLSYTPKTVANVIVTAGKTATVHVTMEQNTSQLAEVTIVGQRTTNTEAAVLAEMREAKLVVSAVSSEQIAKSQDRDAAQVVRRIPGVTIMDNKFIMVRGLSERYNNVMLNNTFAPSMETDVRSFSFDAIPSSQIDRILIFKSPSAELPADFAGGAVKVFTKSIPDETSVVLDYSAGIRQGTSFQPFYQQSTGDWHWTGFNDGYSNLPSGFPRDLRSVNNLDAIQAAGRSLKNNWVANKRIAIPDQRAGITYNGRFNIKDIEVGNVTALNYSNSLTTFDVLRQDFNRYDELNDRPSIILRYDDRQYTQNIRTGLIHNWAFRFNPRHTVEFKNLYNQMSSTQYVDRGGEHYEFRYIPQNGAFDQVYRGFYVGQVTGKHSLQVDSAFKDTRYIDWTAAYSHSYRDQPDYRRFRRDLDQETGESTLYVSRGVSPEYLGRFFSDMTEHSVTATANYNQVLDWRSNAALNPTFSTGFFFENKSRSFNSRNIGYIPGSFGEFNPNSDLWTQPITEIFRPENINNTNGLRVDEQSNKSDNYTALNRLGAAYTSFTIPVSAKITAVAGARVEHNLQTLDSFDDRGPVQVNNPITRVLPSANISYNLTEKMLVRAAYGITLNRPEFRELAPFGFYDFNFNYTVKGNPNLRTASVHNYDLRWELYPSANELVSVGAFNKQFTDAIERAFLFGQGGSGGAKSFTFQNAAEAYSRGVEVDVKKSLAGLTSFNFFEDLSVLLNASYIQSEVNLGASAVGQSDRRPLQGQSNYILNAGIYYNNLNSGIQVNANYNVIGKRIFLVGTIDYPDIYEMPRNVLDLTVSKQITPYFQVKAGIADILNQEVLLLQDGKQDGKLNRNTDQIIQKYHPGRLFNLGLSYSFGKRDL